MHNGNYRQSNASRYIRQFQSRRSLLIWKIYGERLDGWSNDDFPTERVPGDASTLMWHGKPLAANTPPNRNLADLDYRAADVSAAGEQGAALDPMRRNAPSSAGSTWAAPSIWIMTLQRSANGRLRLDARRQSADPDADPSASRTPMRSLNRILIGMHDYYTGLDMDSFTVTADFAIDGAPAGQNLAAKFKNVSQGVWEYRLTNAVATLATGTLTVSVCDRQGNVTRIVRTITVGASAKK